MMALLFWRDDEEAWGRLFDDWIWCCGISICWFWCSASQCNWGLVMDGSIKGGDKVGTIKAAPIRVLWMVIFLQLVTHWTLAFPFWFYLQKWTYFCNQVVFWWKLHGPPLNLVAHYSSFAAASRFLNFEVVLAEGVEISNLIVSHTIIFRGTYKPLKITAKRPVHIHILASGTICAVLLYRVAFKTLNVRLISMDIPRRSLPIYQYGTTFNRSPHSSRPLWTV